ncbi:MAG: prepilin-type N-terminal cleavage/methylation domain-containing protein [Sulfuricella sp.]|nr:prepilin-type N-terminal cleavage/methylation domain-containing protein [Sulfuricella sp.]
MKKVTGFSLVELMIVVAIVGMLAAIVVPTYGEYVQRGKIAEATSQLATMAVKLEQYFQDNRTYSGACAAGTTAPLPSGLQYFTLSCTSLTSATFTVQATGISAKGMGGFTYTIAPNNVKATTSVPAGWSANAACWVTRKDGSC